MTAIRCLSAELEDELKGLRELHIEACRDTAGRFVQELDRSFCAELSDAMAPLKRDPGAAFDPRRSARFDHGVLDEDALGLLGDLRPRSAAGNSARGGIGVCADRIHRLSARRRH
jgi:hypothetical protein